MIISKTQHNQHQHQQISIGNCCFVDVFVPRISNDQQDDQHIVEVFVPRISHDQQDDQQIVDVFVPRKQHQNILILLQIHFFLPKKRRKTRKNFTKL